MWFRIFKPLGLTLFLGLLVACAGVEKTVVGNGALTVEGPRWTPVELQGERIEIPEGAERPFLQLRDGQASGYAGCNRFFGRYTLSDDSLRFEGIAATRMYCPERMTVEDAFMSVLDQVDGYELKKGGLKLFKAGQVLGSFEVDSR